MGKPLGARILLRPSKDEGLRKITKVAPYAEGGFAAMLPYHSARRGLLAKMSVDYNEPGGHIVKREDMTEYGATDRVKLSYHADGFVQFSGEQQGKIVSGRDEATGEPKGLGIMSSPIDTPISTGPTFSIVAWGLKDFTEAGAVAPGDLVFEEEDFYFRGCTPETATGFLIECFVFPQRLWAGVRRQRNRFVLSLLHRSFEGGGIVRDWCAVPLPGQKVFLAFSVSRIASAHPAESGFVLSGPGFRRPDGTGETINAWYPPPYDDRPRTSLDRP
jgi:hypothetical protein